MNRISVGEAISAGFKLIGREPGAFAVWCLAYFALSAIPSVLMWPELGAMYAAMGNGAAMTDPAILASQQKMMAFQPLSLLAGLAALICLPGAAIRATLYPDDRRFFFLRLSMREFWYGVVAVVVFVAWIAAMLATFTPAMLILGAGAATGPAGAAIGGLLTLLVMPVLLGVAIWLFLRMSMAPLMSFVDRNFRFPESWKFTRGHAWRMFLVGLALTGITFVVEAIILGVIVGVGAGRGSLGNPMALLSQVTLPITLALSAVFSVVVVGLYVIGAASWANIYRQLRPDLGDTFA